MGRLLWLRLLVVCAVVALATAAFAFASADEDQGISADVLASPDYNDFLQQQLQSVPSAEDADTVSPRPVVRLRDGTRLQGIRVEHKAVNAFKGVRFAQPPVGSLRWAPPQAYVNPNPDPAVLVDAGRYGASCVQGIPLSNPLGEEDCLFLNVWAPADAKLNSSLPVGVFIHGGSYNTGAGSMYSGAEMVEFYAGKAILVTVNYRLNVFGFLGSELLRAQDPENGSTGNQGLQDQRLAMEWIRDNIGAFGGDKNRVMIFGESAGGGSVSCHLTNKKSWGLFSSAAIESGSMTNWMAQPMDAAESKFQVLVSQSGCVGSNSEVLSCLLGKTTKEIFDWSNSIGVVSTYCTYAPTADGVEMSTHPWISLADGLMADVPILHGTNLDEAVIFAPLPKDANLNQAERYWKRKEFYPNYMYTDADVATLEDLYLKQTYRNLSHVSQEFWAAGHSTGDSHFACGARYMNKMLAQMQVSGTRTSSVYHYHFQHARHNMRFVSHFSEVPYVFNWGYVGFRQYPEDQDMSDVMTAYWGNFIIDHNPSSHSVSYTSQLPKWEPYSAAAENTIFLPSKEGISMGTSLKRDECDFMIPILDKTFRAAFA